MNKRLHIIIILTLLTVLTVRGQESATRQIYYQAESEYDVGRIEQALTILQDNIKEFSGNMQQSAYRLMALCWLGLDNNEKAEEWTRNLLSQDPYYTASSQDPQRFIDMVEMTENVMVGDVYLLCSDGLTDMLKDGEIARLLAEGADATALCNAAVEAGGYDNVSVCLVEVLS